jgi:1,4-dihydroxy-2-naphthoate octaprenyltransferase
MSVDVALAILEDLLIGALGALVTFLGGAYIGRSTKSRWGKAGEITCLLCASKGG